jgi:hypothetical protein
VRLTGSSPQAYLTQLLPWLPLAAPATLPRPQPKNYLDYIATYRRLLQGQRKSNEEMANRLSGAGRLRTHGDTAAPRQPSPTPLGSARHSRRGLPCRRAAGGLSRLEQAATEVAALQKDLSQARVVVHAATEECDQLLVVIASNTADAEARQKAAQEKEEALKGLSAQIEVGGAGRGRRQGAQGRMQAGMRPPALAFLASTRLTTLASLPAPPQVEKAEAEQALSEAIPALEEAAAALNDLKRDEITEIRSFAKPHILVQKVGAARRRLRPACARGKGPGACTCCCQWPAAEALTAACFAPACRCASASSSCATSRTCPGRAPSR